MPEFKTQRVYFNGYTYTDEGISEVSSPKLDGDIDEFYHIFKPDIALICLRIPIYKVKDIDSATKKAKDAGFGYEVNNFYGYFEIRKRYDKGKDPEVVEDLKKLAKEISEEAYYLGHLKDLQLELKTFIVTRTEIKKEGIDEFMKNTQRKNESQE
jgi:hypothetical protein